MPKEIPPATFSYGPRNNPNVSCAFHVGCIWHSTEDCLVFKIKVQEIIAQKLLSFYEEQSNVNTNPLLLHNGLAVNVIIEKKHTEVVKEVAEIKTQMMVVMKKLKEHGFLKDLHGGCLVCEGDPY